MKLKKEIATLLLASTLLTASLTACNTAQNGGDDIDNTTTEITTIETTPDTNPSDTAKPNEVIRDVPELGKLKLVPYSDLKKASIWRDENGEFFLYINEWDAYRELSGLISYYDWLYFTDNCIVIDSETATIALINQDGKHDEPTIITYHFNRDNALVELHAVPLNIIASSEYDTFFVNMHTADHGYYFLTPSMDGKQDWRMDGVSGWPLFMFETTDGGKSWNQISTNTFNPRTSDYINFLKFVSPNVGIVAFRLRGDETLYERTYITVDGGLTWNPISQLPYPSEEGWTYSEIVGMELIDDYYCLTLKLSAKQELQFWSKDLINWSLTEPSFENISAFSNIYADVLEQFEEFLFIKKNYENYDTIFIEQYINRTETIDTLIQATYDIPPTKAGYCIRDINGDGIDELILLDEKYYIYVIFTIVDGQTKVVDTFKGDTNHIGAIGADGTIYKDGYGKGENGYSHVQKLSENGELVGLRFWCKDDYVFTDEVGKAEYFKEINGERTTLNKEEFNALYEEYRSVFSNPTEITKQSGIKFVSMNIAG